jgi:multiple sugar transport system substrate-binding protein
MGIANDGMTRLVTYGLSKGSMVLTRRRFLGLMGFVPAQTGLIACRAGGRPADRPEASEAARRAPVKLTLSHYDDLVQQAQRWSLWSEGFQAKNPHVTVEILQIAPGSAYLEKIPVMFAGGTPPDVLIVHGNWAQSWIPLGFFLHLDPIIQRERYDLSDFWGPLHHKVYVHRGKRYGMTNMTGSGTPAINVNHFRTRGVPLPPTDWKDLRWNWQAYLDTLRALTTISPDGSSGVWGTTTRLTWQAIWSNGGNLMDPNFRECTLDRPEAYEAIQFIADLALRHRVMPTPQELAGKNTTTMWANGEIAIHSVHAGQFTSMRELIKGFEWDIVPDPAGPRGRVGGTGGFGACIAAPTKLVEEAWGWVKHWVSPEVQLMNIEKQLTINASRRSIAARYVDVARRLSGGQPPASLHVVAEQPNYEGSHQYNNRWLDMIAIFDEELGPVWRGQATAKEAMQRAKPRIDAIIREERAKDPNWP